MQSIVLMSRRINRNLIAQNSSYHLLCLLTFKALFCFFIPRNEFRGEMSKLEKKLDQHSVTHPREFLKKRKFMKTRHQAVFIVTVPLEKIILVCLLFQYPSPFKD